jgi:hypothetical protein
VIRLASEVGHRTGWYGFRPVCGVSSLSLRTCGYPGDKGESQWCHDRCIMSYPSSCPARTVDIQNCYSVGGQSGSSFYDSNLSIYAVLSGGPTNDNSISIVAPLTNNLMQMLMYFRWSSAGPISGMTCTQISEAADPHTWHDNYLCATMNVGLRWSSAGPISGMRCTHIVEGADAEGTWFDNYLCVPTSSSLRFQWSSAGPIRGVSCIQWYEGAEPAQTTWHDNFLCY